MKTTFASIKKQEAQKRMAALKQRRDGTRTAEELQQKAGLLDGSQGQITNFADVLKSMGKWAKAR